LKRTLGKDYWNTFVVPFDMSGLEGDIRVLDRVENSTLYFSEAFSMEAGKPYLVKPSNDIVDPVFTDIELSNTHAKSIDNGDYAFVGIYSPTDLATDRTMMFLKTDGKLYYPSTTGTTLKGMRAYFKVPAGQQGARVLIDGDHDVSTDIADVRRQMTGGRYEVYDLQGRSVSDASLKKGIYVVRGKKIVIH
jgi:hypothetical protein